MGKIIEDLHNGNPTGNGYTLKEILTAHIVDDNKKHDEIMAEIRCIKKDYVLRRNAMIVLVFIVSWISWLSREFWMHIRLK